MKQEFFTEHEGDTTGYRRHSAAHSAKVASAAGLWADLLTGRAPSYYLQEALSPRSGFAARAIESNYPGLMRFDEAGGSQTTSDFPLLTGDVLDRMMLARYREFPAGWRQYCKIATLRDFRLVRRIAADGLEGQWESIPEAGEVEAAAMSETGYTYTPKKYGQATYLSFEQLMDDDLDAFMSIPDRLGRGGARTISKFVTQLYVDANGPHASFYTGGNGNVVTGNPVLSIAGLQTAWKVLRSMTDEDGEPIMVEAAYLVVPPALEVTARNILNGLQVWHNDTGGTSNQRVITDNWLGSALKGPIVDPYIPIVASSSNTDTSWYLFADPGIGRPALEVGFLRGYSEPQLFQKLSNTMRVGGGQEQGAGDFATMSNAYKGVVAFGGTRLDPKSTVASSGAGS